MIGLVMLGLFGLTAYAAEEAAPGESPMDVVERAEAAPLSEEDETSASEDATPVEAASWLLTQPSAPSAATLALHREWRTRRFELWSETDIRPGGAWYRHPHGSRYWYQYTGGVEYKAHAWGLYQGFERINVPDFLEVVGEDELRDTVNQGIRQNRLVATTGFGLAATGAGVMVAGVFAANQTRSPEEWLASEHAPGLWPGIETVFDLTLGYDLADRLQPDRGRCADHHRGPLRSKHRGGTRPCSQALPLGGHALQ